MAATDGRPLPIKNTAYRVTFPILDADGDLVTGATGLDSEVSKDAGTFADCTNEATEIATSSGMYYLDLTSTEMNADTVAIIVKTSSSGAKTTPIVLYPVEAGDIDVDVTSWNGTAVASPHTAGYPAVTIKDGTGTGEVDTASGKVSITDGAITAATFAADAITAAKLHSDVTTELQNGLATAASIAALNNLSAAQVNAEVDTALTDIHLDHLLAADYDPASKPGTATALLNELIESDAGVSRYTANALEQAPTGGSAPTAAQIADAVWDEAISGHTALGSTGEALDDASAGGGSAPTAAEVADAVWEEALPAAYTTGKAGYILGTYLDQKISLTNQSPGAGAIQFTYTLTEQGSGDPIANADVWVTSDSAGTTTIASGETNASGVVIFMLDAGTVYLWRQKSGWDFTNPDTETVS